MKLFSNLIILPLFFIPFTNSINKETPNGVETIVVNCGTLNGVFGCDYTIYDDGSDCIVVYGHQGPSDPWFSDDCD